VGKVPDTPHEEKRGAVSVGLSPVLICLVMLRTRGVVNRHLSTPDIIHT
jgi:hypothetical protein